MRVGIFTDKAHPPTMEQVSQAIALKQAAWEELTHFVRERCHSQEEFRFYGKNYGWAYRFRKGGKALVSLYPTQGGLTVQMILRPADRPKALELKVGRHVRKIIESAQQYPEGSWLYIPLESDKDLKDVKQLLTLKLETRQRNK